MYLDKRDLDPDTAWGHAKAISEEMNSALICTNECVVCGAPSLEKRRFINIGLPFITGKEEYSSISLLACCDKEIDQDQLLENVLGLLEKYEKDVL